MSDYKVRYGNGVLHLNWPDGLRTHYLSTKPWDIPLAPAHELRRQCNDPFGRPPLKQLARGRSECLILASGRTKPAAYPQWLPTLLDMLNEAGVPDSGITLYVSKGLEPALDHEQLKHHLGGEAVSRLNILQHDPDSGELIKAGRTDNGTLIHVHRRVLESELLITTGQIHYDWLQGYSGGPEQVLPGCCSRASIAQHLGLAFDKRRGDLHPSVRSGQSLGNPVSEDMHEACTMLKPSFAVNTILGPEHQLLWIGAGDVGYIHRLGAQELDARMRLPFAAQPELVILGAGGAPFDLELSQVAGTLWRMRESFKPGGDVLCIAACSQGEGTGMELLRSLDLAGVRSELQHGVTYAGLAALALRQLTQQYQIHLVSDLPDEIVEAWGMHPHSCVDKALARSMPSRPDLSGFLIVESVHNLLPTRDTWRISPARPVAVGAMGDGRK